MMKKFLALTVALCVLLSTAGCSAVKNLMNGSAASSKDANGAILATDGYADGRIGDILRNDFFEYSVVSANYVDDYAGYKPQAGNVLVDTVLKVKNVFGKELPMFATDFQIQWGDGDKDFGYPIEAKDNTMIPAQWNLAKGATEEYHAVYEVPAGTTDYSISYLEVFEDDSEGDVFFIYFELK